MCTAVVPKPGDSMNLFYHSKRIALRESAQNRSDQLNERLDVSAALMVEVSQLLLHADCSSDEFDYDQQELAHMLMQFQLLDVDGDGLITAADLKVWVSKVDADWANRSNIGRRLLMDEYIPEWLSSVTDSAAAAASLSFVDYIRALIHKRSEEESGYGFADVCRVPVELLQHPFWDLRAVVCSSCATSLSGWMFKRGYTIPVEYMNSWKPRFFRLLYKDNVPYLEYWDSAVEQSQRPSKGSLNLHEISLIDFSPKTVVALSAAAQRDAEAKGMPTHDLTVFKVTLSTGRRFTLACEESLAVNWVAELIRFGNRFQLQAEWRRNWGSERLSQRCLRDWINACAV